MPNLRPLLSSGQRRQFVERQTFRFERPAPALPDLFHNLSLATSIMNRRHHKPIQVFLQLAAM
jgi:hypothetical protein